MDRDGDFSDYAAARWGPLLRTAVFLGCTLDDAHDLVQMTLVRCYTSWPKVAKADDSDAYVFRVLVNCHRDSRRRRWWGERPTAAPPESAIEDPTERVDIADAINRALGDLTKAHREVIVLRYYAHLSEQQTAEALGLPRGTVKSRLSRALAQLAANTHLADLSEGQNR
jgi:RNA polymerase sigma-70 factor (sigma-E family)